MGHFTHHNLRRVLAGFGLLLVVTLYPIAAHHAYAQTQAAAENTAQTLRPEGVSSAAISAGRTQIENRADLTPERKKAALALYNTAEAAITSAQTNLDDAARLQNVMNGAAVRLENLQSEIVALQEAPLRDIEADYADMNAQTLSDLQQTLLTKEASLRALRSRLADLNQELITLQTRRQLAPSEQTENQERLKSLSEQITALGDGDLGPMEQAQRLSMRARLYMRRTKASALEQEIISFGDRQRIITANRDIAQLEQKRLSEEVATLQRLTGQQRLIDAGRLVTQAQEMLDALEDPHPMVTSYGLNNIALAKDLGAIAQAASALPKITAEKRTMVDIVDADLRTSTSLIELGNLSRQSAKTLRNLRNDSPSAVAIRADIKAINQDIAEATQARLLAQDRLRDFQPGELDILDFQQSWMAANPGADPLDATGFDALEALHDARRDLLNEISTAASDHYDALTTLKSVQQNLLQRTEQINALLDQNLLWLPSTAVIGLSWPGDVLRGALETFSLNHIDIASRSLLQAARDNLALVLVFIIIIGACYSMRKTLWRDVVRRASLVGRVKKDTYWHTPAVMLACIIIALPLALVFFLLSLLLHLSQNADYFVVSLAETFEYLALFTLFFLTWRAWDRDLSLFDSHFKLPKSVRHSINRQLVWFIPLAGTVTAIITLTNDSPQRVVYEGLSLAAFIAMCFAIAVFSYNILWKDRHEKNKRLSEDSWLRRYRSIAAVFAISLPLLSAFFASCGYFETASELMSRVFISGWLIVGTYVIHGIIRRFILVGKRRLALRQAIERRDKAVKVREDKAAAQERGETISTPPVDYETIDIETLSRQTAQLINAIIIVGFAALMWLIWSSLMPALTFFNGVELSSYMVNTINPETGQNESVARVLTLWNVMQAGVIIGLTILAARNLPSFLEIFILSRVGVSPGTRYAIVTILGYMIIATGIIVTFGRLGLQWSQLKFVAAGLSVGIGFGLQKIIANFVSGLIILFERPIRLGDYVTIGEQSGNVSRIQIRATTLVDLDNKEILIPNEALVSERVTNWTLSSASTRLIVPVGIAYGSDTERAQLIMLETLNALPSVQVNPAPQVLFMGFGDSSLDFELRVFLKCFEDRVPTRHAIHMAINKALAEANISIPFPQRDLHIIQPPKPKSARKKPSASKAKSKRTSSEPNIYNAPRANDENDLTEDGD